MEEKIEQLKAQAAEAIKNAAGNLSELDDIRVKFLGKKGEFTTILRGMGALAKEDRPKVGKIVNEAKAEIAQLIQQKNEELKAREMQQRLEREKIDVTLPGRQQPLGHLHPLTLTLERIKDIFFRMGFSVEEGPEIEKDYYNFEALNLPKDHPARDMQDSFYITEDILMRSQTSPVQARTMQKNEPNAPICRSSRRSRASSSMRASRSLTSRARSSSSCARSSARMSRSACARASSRSRSRRRRSISPASCATARAARSARVRAGSRSSAPAWCTRMCWR